MMRNLWKKLYPFLRAMIKRIVLFIYNMEVRILPIRKRVIVFSSNLGRNYSGNPKAIYEEMVRLGLDRQYRCVWFLNNIRTDIPGQVRKVKNERMSYLYYMAVAKIWIFDCRQPSFLIKRKGVYYLQTWHGTPLKKLALDLEDVRMAGETDIDTYKDNFRQNILTWDSLLSQNNYSTLIFKRCFDFQGDIFEIGYPRNDVLIQNNSKEYQMELKKKLNLPMDKKILLYAPTWRDNEYYKNGEYKFNPPMAFNYMRTQLGNEYIMIVKYHYLVKEYIDWATFRDFIYEFDMSYDISELYLVSDMLITDYSSVMFDYSLLKRPMLFYTYDLENYKKNLRGFYFDFIHEAPGPISLSTDDLIDDIKNYDERKYKTKYKAFLDKYNHRDNGHAANLVVNLIMEKLNNRAYLKTIEDKE